jgi:hypothetical protein
MYELRPLVMNEKHTKSTKRRAHLLDIPMTDLRWLENGNFGK